MTTYFLSYLSLSLLTLVGQNRLSDPHSGYFNNTRTILWAMLILYLTIMIGLRHEVGGDWLNYLWNFEDIDGMSLTAIFSQPSSITSDPLYLLISWLSSLLGLGIYGVNLICAAIFSIGLASLCRSFQRPLLGLSIAFPYLIIVVAMGYTRQSAALGFVMIGIAALLREKNLKFIIYVFLAALIHKSAIIMLPIIGFSVSRSRILLFFFGILFFILGYFLFLADNIEFLIYGYIQSGYQSEGALIRLSMNALPAFLFIFLRSRFIIKNQHEINFWLIVSYVSVSLLLIYPFFPSSTLLDRVALYLLPIQLFVFSNLPYALSDKIYLQKLYVFLVLGWYLLVMCVWLFFASNRFWWVPYNNLITEIIFQ